MNDGTLIFLGFLMLIGQVVIIQMIQSNWFKKENFKITKSRINAENKLKLKKLERELGLKDKKQQPAAEPATGGLDNNMIQQAIDAFTRSQEDDYEEDEEDNPIVNAVANIAKSNPELVQNLLGRISKPQDQETRYLGD